LVNLLAPFPFFEVSQTQVSGRNNNPLSRLADFVLDYLVPVMTAAMLLAVIVLLVVLWH
jgi:hypothetical protein